MTGTPAEAHHSLDLKMFSSTSKSKRPSLEDWKNIAQVTAVVGAGLFFSTKVWDGWFSADMEISISTQRQHDPADSTKDLLGVTVHLKKGDRGTIGVHTAELRTSVGSDRNNTVISPLPQALRLKQRGEKDEKLDWTGYDSRPYNISANETTQYGSVVSVPAGAAVLVEFALVGQGRTLFSKKPSQWRASAVSLPTPRKPPESSSMVDTRT
jgi:hypothetical protein